MASLESKYFVIYDTFFAIFSRFVHELVKFHFLYSKLLLAFLYYFIFST